MNLTSKNLKHIRIGTKALAYWPFRFLTDDDADDLLKLFSDVKKAGKHLAFMAHFNHPAELKHPAVKDAIERILETGAVIRTQSPVMKHINDSPQVWAEMLQKQVESWLHTLLYVRCTKHRRRSLFFNSVG